MADHATTGDAINHVADKIGDGISQLSHTLNAAAPKVAQMATATVQANAFATLICGAEAIAILTVALFVWVRWYWPWANRSDNEDMDVAKFFGGIGLGATMLGCGIIIISTICDPWTYIALQHPDLYLAKQVMDSLKPK